MRVLILTQVFYPDTVSVSQHLTDLAEHLSAHSYDVNVFSSRYPYEGKFMKYSPYEEYKGINIHRLRQTKLGKNNTTYRIIDFLTFYISIGWKLLFIRKKEYDVVIGTTVPPLLSFFAILVTRIKSIPFYYWVMDLQPELSIESGLIKKESISAKVLTKIGNYSIRNSEKIFSLDRFMTDYLITRGAVIEKIYTIPVWPVIDSIYTGERKVNPFRIENGFGDRIVVMYSGNHAYVHPLDTLLESANALRNDDRFVFVFVGGGVRKKDVEQFKTLHKLENIIQLPFQPRSNIHFSLGSSDIQVVIMGDGQTGYTHPNKIYGALFIGKPIVYIGPERSHVTDILSKLPQNIIVNHGDAKQLVSHLLDFAAFDQKDKDAIGLRNRQYAIDNFSPEVLKSKMLQAIEE